MEMQEIIANIKPPGIEKKKRRSIYRIIGRIVQCLVVDSIKVLHNFFPLLADEENLKLHAQALSIPLFPFDTPEEFRQRVATAGYYLYRRGQRGLVKEILDKLVPERYQLLEYPKAGFRIKYSKLGYAPLGGGIKLFVKVRNITQEEKQYIELFLDEMLDPDIEIHVIDWIYNPVSPVGIDLLRKLGGARWLVKQLEDICPVKVALFPDDGFRISYERLGYSRLIPDVSIFLLIYIADSNYVTAIENRLTEILNETIERRIYIEQN